MNLNQIPISIHGIDYTVDYEFFKRLSILEENLIGDTYFIKSKDSEGHFYLSVNKNFYEILKEKMKIEERDFKIKIILK